MRTPRILHHILQASIFESERGCDFCAEHCATVAYPARHVEPHSRTTNVHTGRVIELVQVYSKDDWTACDTCRALIDAGRRDELAARSHEQHLARHASELAGLTREQRRSVARQMRTELRSIHDAFWSAREGPAVKRSP